MFTHIFCSSRSFLHLFQKNKYRKCSSEMFFTDKAIKTDADSGRFRLLKAENKFAVSDFHCAAVVWALWHYRFSVGSIERAIGV